MRKLRVPALLAVGVVLVLWFVFGRGRSPEPSPTPLPSPASPRPSLPRARLVAPEVRKAQPAPRKLPPRTSTLGSPSTPIIDEISFEKTSACEGEEVLVTVRAHTPGGKDDAYLHGRLGGIQGMRFPMIATRPPIDARPLQVLVYGRGETPVRRDLPWIDIKDCTEPYRLFVAHRPRANAIDEFDFEAKLSDESPRFAAVSYRWDLGDGTVLETSAPTVVHSYADRPQASRFSDFLVTVEAVDAAGKRLRGRKTIFLENRSFASLAEEGRVLVLASVTPRYPERAVMSLRPRIRLWHDYPGEVTLSRVRIVSERSDDQEVTPVEASAMEALGVDSIPIGGVTIELDVDVPDAKVVALHHHLEGVTADGMKAEGYFSVYLGPREEVAAETIPGKRGMPVFDDAAEERRRLEEEAKARDKYLVPRERPLPPTSPGSP